MNPKNRRVDDIYVGNEFPQRVPARVVSFDLQGCPAPCKDSHDDVGYCTARNSLHESNPSLRYPKSEKQHVANNQYCVAVFCRGICEQGRFAKELADQIALMTVI